MCVCTKCVFIVAMQSLQKRLQALSLESKQLDVEVSQRRDLQDKVADEMRAVSEVIISSVSLTQGSSQLPSQYTGCV